MQKYDFRGIDDVYSALSPLLEKHKLVILPRVLSRDVIERKSQSGGALFYVSIDVEFDFVSTEDCSKHTIKIFGEAMDSGDKATNKAMSAAYKYACLQAFCIPTDGDNDADATTHEVAHNEKQTHLEQMSAQQFSGFEEKIMQQTDIEQLRSVLKSSISAARAIGDEEAIKDLKVIAANRADKIREQEAVNVS